MKIVDSWVAYALLFVFAAAMLLVTTIWSRREHRHTAEGFMAAGRQVPWWLGAISIAVSWIWAPALFVSVQQAYQQGVPGIFWFTLPNIVCLFIMAPLALRIRRFFPAGFSQPEWVRCRFDSRTHKLYLIPFFWYQLMAVTVQLYAGGSIFSVLTGARVEAVMLVLAATTLAYGIISGMRASILTDFLQYALILGGGLVLVPWTILSAGGWPAVKSGLGGVGGMHTSIFDVQVAWNFGIVTSIGLISGVLSDQQHWQRAFTIRKEHLRKAYFTAGLLFGVVPIALSTLGFLAANPSLSVVLPPGADPSMIGVATVARFLPTWAVLTFVVMLLAGLCSTLDSGLCAAASLYAANCFRFTQEEMLIRRKQAQRETLSENETTVAAELDRKTVKRGQQAMVAVTLAGLLLSFLVLRIPGFGLKYLWWIFNTIAACVAVPTVLSLYWNRLSSKGVFFGVLTAFFLGIPLFIYGNITENSPLIIASSIGIISVTALFAFSFPRGEPFRLDSNGSCGSTPR